MTKAFDSIMALLELDNLFDELLTSKRRPRYGISVTDASPDLAQINVEFRFLAGRSYCCTEPFCHLPLTCGRLVRLAAERSIHLPEDVVVHWHCVVEAGVRLQYTGRFGLAESEAYEYDAVSSGPSPKKTDGSENKPPPDFTGLWTVDHDHGARIEIEYVNGVANGSYRYWYDNGVCHREGFMKNGQRHGTWTIRGSDGTVFDVSEFNEGTGVYKIFFANGQISDEIPMRHGKCHGASKRWSQGKVVEIRHYVNGEFVAANCQWPRKKPSG